MASPGLHLHFISHSWRPDPTQQKALVHPISSQLRPLSHTMKEIYSLTQSAGYPADSLIGLLIFSNDQEVLWSCLLPFSATQESHPQFRLHQTQATLARSDKFFSCLRVAVNCSQPNPPGQVRKIQSRLCRIEKPGKSYWCPQPT